MFSNLFGMIAAAEAAAPTTAEAAADAPVNDPLVRARAPGAG